LEKNPDLKAPENAIILKKLEEMKKSKGFSWSRIS